MATPARPARLGPSSPPPQTPITDFAALEGQKENIQPLSTGRSAHALSTIFAQRPKQLEKDLRDAQAKFEHELTECEQRRRKELQGGDLEFGESDPLDVFERYIKHIREVAPSGSTQSSILIPLLERCTRTLLAEGDIWAQDFRYVRIWIQYSRLIDRKTDVFDFLLAREVGTDWSALYEEWAVVLEGLGRRSEADKAYRLGLARKAKPVERLQQRYKAFQVRMLTPAPFIPEPSTATGSTSRTPARNALGTISTTAAGLSLSSTTPKANNGKRGGLAIFVDGEEDSDKKWEADLGTRDAVRKENEREAVSFKSAEVLPQGRGIAPRTPKLEVFRDETAASTPSAHAVEDVFTRSNAPAQWELIVQDPLANMRALPAPPPRAHRAEASAPPPAVKPLSTSNQSHHRSHSSSRPPPAANPTGFVTEMPKWQVPDSTPPIAKNGKPEVRKFKWDMVFHDGREWSFEECRAASLGVGHGGKDLWADAPARPVETPAAKPSPPISIFQDAPPPPPTPAAALPPRTPSVSIFADPPPAPTPVSAPAPAINSFVPIAPPAPTPRAVAPTPKAEPTPKPKNRPSPTVNTKAALADVLDMYNAGAGDDSDEEDSDESEDDEEDSFMQGGGGGVQMMAPEQGYVPPTPTPAQGHVQSQIRPSQLFQPAFGAPQEQDEEEPASSGRLDVFSDEPEPPASAPSAAVFRDENAVPSRTPGGPSKTPARTPLSVRKPTFEIFSDAVPQPAQPSFTTDENAAPAGRQSFATPMPESKQPLRRGLGAVPQVTEEDEDEDEGRQQDDEDDAAYRSNRPVWDGRVGGFELMTPITERTGEYSTMGGGRASMGARSSMGGRGGILEEDEEEEEDEGDKAFVVETDEAATSAPATDALSPLGRVAHDGRDSRDATPEFDSFTDRSGRTFGLSDGYTIDGFTGKTADLMNTVNIVDQTGTVNLDTLTSADAASTEEAAPPADAPPVAPMASSPTLAQLPRHAPLVASITPPSAVPARLQPLPPAALQSPVRPSVAKAIAASSPVAAAARPKPAGNIPNPCNPMDPEIMNLLIASLDPPLAALPGFKDFTSTTANRLDGLQKSAKQKARRGSTGSSKSGVGRDETSFGEINLGGDVYEVKEKIGEGGFGAVFLAKDLSAAGDVTKSTADAGSDDGSDDDSDDDEGPSHLVALKVEKPSGIWEGLVLDRVHTRLEPASLRSSIISSKGLYAFADESYLVLSYSSQGTLLDAVNSAAKLGIASTASTPGAAAGMDELVVLFFAVELLKVVEGLHRAEIIHGDLKIDNCLVRLEDVPTSEWTAQYDAGGGGGWAKKGVRMIDFGKSIDMSLFPAREKQTFVAEWEVDQRDCVEMREARPWSYQTDYHGLASVFYCMLFGKYIETVAAPSQPGVNTKRYKIATPLKRYWQTDLWTRLFDLLLNPRVAAPTSGGNLPICDDLAAIRVEMAQLVGEKCMKDGKNLRSLLKKLELGSLQGR